MPLVGIAVTVGQTADSVTQEFRKVTLFNDQGRRFSSFNGKEVYPHL